jgi:UDP-N-acetylglucosamine--N-acetylmuramyl-(pentapeptide) pyrophosphoryl-undecaprenol N-acetylglucosamine transferase
MTRTVLFAGGGTAGHVFPAIAVAQALVELDPDIEPVFVGVADRLEAQLVPAASFRIHTITTPAIPRRLSPKLLRVPAGLRRSVARCVEIAGEEHAVAAVTFGGYVSFPVARAAATCSLPLVIHEQNAVPGLANRLASRWADRIAVSVPGSADRFRRPERCAVTGNPVREDIASLDRSSLQAEARERFGLDPDRPTLLVFGGSQGARSLNRAIVAAHGQWGDQDLQVLHATGRATHEPTATAWAKVRERDDGPRVNVLDFIESMADAYAAADLVICRAGATSIAELTVLGIPSVLVPYPHATADHQTENARALERAGGAVVIPDDELDAESLLAACRPLLADADRLRRVADAARAFGRPDAASNVARLVTGLVDARSPSR